MEDFDFEKWVSGFAHCPHCQHVWMTTVPYGQFVSVECPRCHGLVGELTEAKLCSS